MKENILRQRIKDGKPMVSTRLWSANPWFTEAAGLTGHFDYIEFVAEYAPFDFTDLPNIARAAELNNMGTMIKIDLQNRAYVAQKAIQAGFQSILFVDHCTADQVRESVAYVKPKTSGSTGLFGYPQGRYIGGQPAIPILDHIQRLQDTVLCFMIEKEQAVENIEEICKVPGVDMIQFGPNDYCMSRGWLKDEHTSDFKTAERHCIEVALANGVRPRCEINSPADADYYIKLGVRDFSIGDEFVELKAFWNSAGKEMRAIADRL